MIYAAEKKDARRAAELACLLWPEHGTAEMAAEMEALIESPEAAVFLCEEEGQAVGFAQCQLRHDYVEGTEGGPVGYLEGIYVSEGRREKGVARALLAACEEWAREKGCREFASDCELDNTASLDFHLCCGFTEANRIICFTKRLETADHTR